MAISSRVKIFYATFTASFISMAFWNIYNTKKAIDLENSILQLKVENQERSRRDVTGDTLRESTTVPTTPNSGATYVHWGRTTCSDKDVELVYTGVVGGSHYDQTGGGSNYLCMPHEPIYDQYINGNQGSSYLYGAEYEFPGTPFSTANGVGTNHNVPCAVCRVLQRSSSIMIPARNICYEGWTLEYKGYLVAGHHGHKGRFQHVCMDNAPEADPAGYRDENGALFYAVEGICGSLPCPNYVEGRELTCAVCTK